MNRRDWFHWLIRHASSTASATRRCYYTCINLLKIGLLFGQWIVMEDTLLLVWKKIYYPKSPTVNEGTCFMNKSTSGWPSRSFSRQNKTRSCVSKTEGVAWWLIQTNNIIFAFIIWNVQLSGTICLNSACQHRTINRKCVLTFNSIPFWTFWTNAVVNHYNRKMVFIS